jgi:hypothetical protein
MSGYDRRKYLTSSVLNQELLNWCHDNLENRLELIVDIETPGIEVIRASDRNKYVGNIFYEALLNFPVINRTVGEWLSPTIQFSNLSLEISNADGRFNKYLPEGAQYNGFIGRTVEVSLGLAEQGSTYTKIFSGKITDIGGMSRSTFSINFIARDLYDDLSVNFPTQAFTVANFPYIDDSVAGKLVPVIYGDWTIYLDPDLACIPAYIVNGLDPDVQGGTREDLQLVISINGLVSFDTTNVYLFKSDIFWLVTAADVYSVGPGNNTFRIKQNSGLWDDDNGTPIAYLYTAGDVFFVRVKGKDLGAYDDNIVAQAKDLLLSYSTLTSGDLDANWDTFSNKAAPPQSAISTLKSRIWENEPKPLINYVLSLLEQVRLEAFVDRNLKIKINSLHFEDFISAPTYEIKNWDIVEASFSPKIDEKNLFNRVRGDFDYHPNRNLNTRLTPLQRNNASISQINREISKQIIFPNLYIQSEVIYQIVEIIKISSSLFETVDCQLTWRSMLKDIGDFVLVNVQIGAAIFESVPMMIRDLGYDPAGLKIPVRMWSFQLLPFPGYTPGYSGIVGGYNATITQE